MQKINDTVTDIRLHGLWMMLGEKIVFKLNPIQTERDIAVFSDLFLDDPAAAPLLRESVDYFPNTKKIEFFYSEYEPTLAEGSLKMADPMDLKPDGSKYCFRFYRDSSDEMATRIYFWRRKVAWQTNRRASNPDWERRLSCFMFCINYLDFK